MQAAQIDIAAQGRYVLTGDLTFETVAGAHRAAMGRLDFRRDGTLDLSALGHVNSAGIALLLDWCARFRKHGASLRLEQAPTHLQRLLKVNELEIDGAAWCEGHAATPRA